MENRKFLVYAVISTGRTNWKSPNRANRKLTLGHGRETVDRRIPEIPEIRSPPEAVRVYWTRPAAAAAWFFHALFGRLPEKKKKPHQRDTPNIRRPLWPGSRLSRKFPKTVIVRATDVFNNCIILLLIYTLLYSRCISYSRSKLFVKRKNKNP